MNLENKLTFDFVTIDGEEARISGKLIHSTYDTYFELRSAFIDGEEVDEDHFCEEDLERMVEDAEEYLSENELYRE